MNIINTKNNAELQGDIMAKVNTTPYNYSKVASITYNEQLSLSFFMFIIYSCYVVLY